MYTGCYLFELGLHLNAAKHLIFLLLFSSNGKSTGRHRYSRMVHWSYVCCCSSDLDFTDCLLHKEE